MPVYAGSSTSDGLTKLENAASDLKESFCDIEVQLDMIEKKLQQEHEISVETNGVGNPELNAGHAVKQFKHIVHEVSKCEEQMLKLQSETDEMIQQIKSIQKNTQDNINSLPNNNKK